MTLLQELYLRRTYLKAEEITLTAKIKSCESYMKEVYIESRKGVEVALFTINHRITVAKSFDK